ncbi:MAG: hotdog domain-containing protein [Acidimicrobiia bacterium]|nr:hotdog domain-containing protein [Acidimicrobiia bacterium]
MNELVPGLSGSHQAVVAEADTAIALGSGSVPVLATPRLVAWLEAAAVAALACAIPDGSTTVGTHIDLRHTAPTAVGRQVDVVATVSSVEGRTIAFELQAQDGGKPIASGLHLRVIVDAERFLNSL